MLFKLIPGNSIFLILPLERSDQAIQAILAWDSFHLDNKYGVASRKCPIYKLSYVDDTTDVFESDVVSQPSALGGGSP